MTTVDLHWGERRHVDVRGVSIHVETAGPPAGHVGVPTLVCLHGFGSGTFTWAAMAALLVDELRPGTGTVGPAALRVALLGAGTFLRAGGRHRNAITDATAAETARTLRRPGTATAMWHLTRTWTPPTAAANLADLDVPVTVIAGADDRIIPLASLRNTVDAPGWDVHVLDGVGHAPQEQAPEQVAELVRGVIAGPGRRS